MSDTRVLGGRYRLQQTIGHGGMAEVYAAHDEILDRTVAVKLLLPRFSSDEQFIARFRREAQAAASLNHPNVVSVYDTGEDGGLPYIVMELVRGRSLADVVHAGGLLETRVLEVVADAAAALQYAHERGLVHRDVKPGNILVADDGTVKVTDFGIARAIDADSVTKTASVLGTAAYLSPEQAQGLEVDVRSDVYSLGVVLYELLTRRPPFQGATAVGVAYQHVQEAPVPPRSWDPGISPAAEAIAIKAMAKSPANRYQSARDMRADLLQARAGRAVSAPAVMAAGHTAMLDLDPAHQLRPPVAPVAARRRRVIGYVVLTIATIAAFALGVWYVAGLLEKEPVATAIVPLVRNMTAAEAEDLLESRGLTMRVVDQLYDASVEPGHVASQDPSAGESVVQETVVNVVLSLGAEQVTVPIVIGLTEAEAVSLLQSVGLVAVKGQDVFDPLVAVGVVVSTSPAADARVQGGSEVTYVLSAGLETVRVPPVEQLTEAEAKFRLEEADFVVLIVREFSDIAEEGRVVRQDPAAGEPLPRGAEVTIVVSNGPQSTEPPTPSDEPTPDPSTEPEPTPTATGT